MDEAADKMIACIPRLRRYARALVGDRGGADDLVQDTLERAWGKLASWRRDGDMRPWLFSIMHNLHVDRFRRPALATEPIEDDSSVPEPHAPSVDRLEIRDMEYALGRLPAEQREILLLVALEGMSYEEVAATLLVPVGTVMSRLARGREKLRALMEGRPAKIPLKVIK